MLTERQAQTAKAIVNIFETGSVLGDYGQVTLIHGDTGRLTYGRSQTTLGSGGLHKLIARYCESAGARFAGHLSPFLPQLQDRAVEIDRDRYFHNLLRAAADDPLMRSSQDSFFDDHYWQPATREAQGMGISSPLGVAVVYDSRVHGSFGLIRDRTNDALGSVGAEGERPWISAYVQQRKAWLGNHDRADLRRTVYRMDAFERLIGRDDWALDLPLVVRRHEISEAALDAVPPGTYDGPAPGSRSIQVGSPLPRGLDVRLLQLALTAPERGFDLEADGIFGNQSARAVRDFQARLGHPPTGTVDAALFTALGLA